MLAMGYFRAPKLGGKKSSSPEREGLLLLDGEVPKGYFAVYVGPDARRFVVPMSLLCEPAFRDLMERAAEEFGFGQAGGLRIPCQEEDFVATVAALQPEAARQRRRSAAAGGSWRSISVNW